MFKLWSARLSLLLVSFALIGGIGCATLLTASQLEQIVVSQGPIVLEDSILALGKPDPAMLAQLKNPQAVAFLGQKHSYLLVEGGAALQDVAQSLDGLRVELLADKRALFLQDQTVWGHVYMRYLPEPGQAFSEAELASLKRLKFSKDEQGGMQRAISIKGAVYPALDLNGLTRLKRDRALVFRAPPTSSRKPNLASYALLPAAIVVDVVTSPIQLGLFVIFMISS